LARIPIYARRTDVDLDDADGWWTAENLRCAWDVERRLAEKPVKAWHEGEYPTAVYPILASVSTHLHWLVVSKKVPH
jgi:hypothetical protein